MGRVALSRANRELNPVSKHMSLEADPSPSEPPCKTPALTDISINLCVRECGSRGFGQNVPKL